MPAAPALSVVLPVFNGVSTLGPALDSLRCQSFPDWEAIVVNDGSTDGSAQLVEHARNSDPRIRLLNLPHQGIATTLNAGIAAASSQIIVRMDADDLCHPLRFARLAEAFQTHPHAGLVGSCIEFCGDRESRAGYAAHVDWSNSVVFENEIRLNRFVESPFAHPSVAYRREVVARHGGYRDGAYPEDYELWLRWLEAGVRMIKLPDSLLTWTDHPDRLSRRDARYSTDAFYRLKALYLARWIARHVPAERELWIWGAGRLTRRRVEFLTAHGACPAAYLDIDENKLGSTRTGLPVHPPQHLASLSPDHRPFVLGYVANRGARDLQRAFLSDLGWTEGDDFLFAA